MDASNYQHQAAQVLKCTHSWVHHYQVCCLPSQECKANEARDEEADLHRIPAHRDKDGGALVNHMANFKYATKSISPAHQGASICEGDHRVFD
jgi:hypothetical protein